MGYWISESYGLWVEIPCIPTWSLQNSMGIREYGSSEVWVMTEVVFGVWSVKYYSATKTC